MGCAYSCACALSFRCMFLENISWVESFCVCSTSRGTWKKQVYSGLLYCSVCEYVSAAAPPAAAGGSCASACNDSLNTADARLSCHSYSVCIQGLKTVRLGDSNHPLTCTCLALQWTSRNELSHVGAVLLTERASKPRRSPPSASSLTPPRPPLTPLPDPRSPSPREAPLLIPRYSSLTPLRWPWRPLRRRLTIQPPLLALGPRSAPQTRLVPPSPLGPGAWGDVMFVFLSRLVVGHLSIIHPAAAPIAREPHLCVGRRVCCDASLWPGPGLWSCLVLGRGG
jgi:hypothetical protein